ncbi:MAG TPA: cytochrome c [Nitrospira sp.]|nr:cytochrome c [Nitrospira sp.]
MPPKPITARQEPSAADSLTRSSLERIQSASRFLQACAHCLPLIALLVSSGTGVLLAQPSDGLQRGQTLYREHCMDCHGTTGKGDGPKAPFLSPRPGNLISAATSAKTDKELLRTIAQGKPRTAMPGWKESLPDEDQQAVLQYIRSLIQFSRSPAGPPPAP